MTVLSEIERKNSIISCHIGYVLKIESISAYYYNYCIIPGNTYIQNFKNKRKMYVLVILRVRKQYYVVFMHMKSSIDDANMQVGS